MKAFRNLAAATAVALTIGVTACGGGAAPAASPGAQPASQSSSSSGGASSPTAAPVAATSAPTVAPTTQPKPAATATPAPAPTASSGIADLIAKAKGLGDYTYDYKLNVSGTTMSGKTYVKGTKMRQEITFSGTKMVTLMDTATKVAYSVMPDQKVAMKVDFSKLQGGNSSPTDQVTGMPADTKVAGTDTVDGKSATIYQYMKDGTTAKLWIWTEKSVPLKADVTGSGVQAHMEFSNYEFGPLDAGLFEVPKDYTVTELPTNFGGVPGGSVPVPAPKATP